jgi:hypothetical protein
LSLLRTKFFVHTLRAALVLNRWQEGRQVFVAGQMQYICDYLLQIVVIGSTLSYLLVWKLLVAATCRKSMCRMTRFKTARPRAWM